MGSRTDDGAVACDGFTSHFFKPNFCIHCFQSKAVHAAGMPSRQNVPADRHRGLEGSVQNNLWIRANKTVNESNNRTSFNPPKVNRKPVLRSRLVRQEAGDGTSLSTRAAVNTRNAYQPPPTVRSRQSSNGKLDNKILERGRIASDGPPARSEPAGVSRRGGIASVTVKESDVYEAIFPTNETIENRVNAALETSQLNQRPCSDVAAYHRKGDHEARRVSSPPANRTEAAASMRVLEFQRLAGRLKHTGWKGGGPGSSPDGGEVGVLVHTSRQRRDVPPRCGYSQVDIHGGASSRKNTVQGRPAKSGPSPPWTNVSFLDKACFKSSASSTSSGELCSDEASNSRSSSINSSTSTPVAPVRSDSRKKKKTNSEEPGFALESLLPDSITIISANGTREVVTSQGNSQTTTTATDITKEAARSKEDPDTDDTSKTVTTTTATVKPKMDSPLSDVYKLVGDTEVAGPVPSSPRPYEVMMVGPIQNGERIPSPGLCPPAARPLPEFPPTEDFEDERGTPDGGRCGLPLIEEVHQETVTSTSETYSGTDIVPPFPVILHDENGHKAKNRHSGNYKVPIFIQHQDYDNLGTVLADQDYESMQFGKPIEESVTGSCSSPGHRGAQDDMYYLKPNDEEEPKDGIDAEAINEDEYEFVRVLQSSPTSVSEVEVEEEEEKAEEEGHVAGKPPRRNRSKTHPMFCKEGHLVSRLLAKPSAEGKNKMKRTAPRPPELCKVDTMPRTPPPPPPTDESRRLSKELQEGIMRYHRSACAPKSTAHLSKGPSSYARVMKGQKELLAKPGHVPLGQVKESTAPVQELVADGGGKGGENATTTERKPQAKPNLHVSAGRGKSALTPMISPPRTHLLHQLNLSDSSNPVAVVHEGRQKEKKSRLFWKRRKRKEDGSPEREFNTEVVTQWLDETHQFTQRRSWERMEVINAYKGQETALIGPGGLNSPDAVCCSKRKAPKPPGEANSSSDSKLPGETSSDSQPSPRGSERKISGELASKSEEKSKGDLCSITTNSSDQTSQDIADGPFKPPPRTRSQRRRRETVHETPEYVNLAFLMQNKTPPVKPRRRARGPRSLTTGFENLPSVTKRMAPKTPREEPSSDGGVEPLSTSDPESRDTKEVYKVPLKSALKKKVGGGAAAAVRNARDGDAPPKRPVRLIHTSAEPFLHDQYGLPKSGYVNLEVKQKDFWGTPDETTDEEGSVVPRPGTRGADDTLGRIRSVQCQTLAQVGQLYPMRPLDKVLFQERCWEDFIVHEKTLAFPDEKTTCYRAELKGHPQEFCLMVFHHQDHLDKVIEAAKELESFPPHPNLLNVVHTFRAAPPWHLFDTNSQDEASQPAARDSADSQSDAVIVITSQVPTSSAAHFIEEAKPQDAGSHERYEAQAWGMILQVCRGVAHAQMYEPTNSLEGLKQESVLEMGNGSGVWLFNPLVVGTLSSSASGRRRGSVVSHLMDKCCEFDLGIMIYELLHQPNPFAVRTNLMSRNYTPDDLPVLPERSTYSATLMALVRKLLRRCPEKRISAEHAVWAMHARTVCPTLSSKPLAVSVQRLEQQIAVKRTEITCGLAAQQCGGLSGRFTIREKLDIMFWSEVDSTKLEGALTSLRE